MTRTLALSVATFVATNVDDLLLLAALFASGRLRTGEIVAGQLLGILTLVGASAVLALGALAIPEGWTALLGVVPLGLGLRQWRAAERDAEHDIEPDPDLRDARTSRLLGVAALTIASGGDNLGIYVPLFASSPAEIPIHVLVFTASTGVWCAAGARLAHDPRLGVRIRTLVSRALPWVLVALGLYILAGARVLFAA